MKNKISRFLTTLLKPLVEVRPGERGKTLVMSAYFFLIIATVWILKPVRDSLFLEEMGAKSLWGVYIAEGAFMAVVAFGFSQLAKRVTQKTLYLGILSFYIGCIVLFWFLFRTPCQEERPINIEKNHFHHGCFPMETAHGFTRQIQSMNPKKELKQCRSSFKKECYESKRKFDETVKNQSSWKIPAMRPPRISTSTKGLS